MLEARSSPALDDFPPFVKSYVLGHGQHTALLLHMKGSQVTTAKKNITRAFLKKNELYMKVIGIIGTKTYLKLEI